MCFVFMLLLMIVCLLFSFSRYVFVYYSEKNGHVMPNRCPTLTKVCILPFKLLKLDDILYIKMFKKT